MNLTQFYKAAAPVFLFIGIASVFAIACALVSK